MFVCFLPEGNGFTERRRCANKNDAKKTQRKEVVAEKDRDDKAGNAKHVADGLCDKPRCERGLLEEKHVNDCNKK